MTPLPVGQPADSGERPDADDRSYGQSLLAACPEEASKVAAGLCGGDGRRSRRRRAADRTPQRLRLSSGKSTGGLVVPRRLMDLVEQGQRT